MTEAKKIQGLKEHDLFAAGLQQTQAWLAEIMVELNTQLRHRAYLALRAVIQTLRDRLTVDEAVHLGAQLPLIIRGLYYEGWQPSVSPLKYNKAEFLDHIKQYFRNEPKIDSEAVTRAVLTVLQRNISEGEIRKVMHALPKEFLSLWQLHEEETQMERTSVM
jgi:uncharacterized protein (DUF2267 family)